MPTLTTIESLTVLVERPRTETRPPMLLLHGLFAEAGVWEPLMYHWSARGHACYALNFRGRVGSRPGTDLGAASMQDFAEDAVAVANHLGTPIVVGHSMGGLVAQMIAARKRARALVLFAPAPPRGISVMSVRLAIKQARYLPRILMSRIVSPDREDLRAMVMNQVPPADQDLLISRLIDDSGRAGRDMSIAGVPVDASKIDVPVLVLTGDRDRFIPQNRVERIAARYGAQLLVAKGRGHMLVLEPGWDDLARDVDAWLDTAVALDSGARRADDLSRAG